MVNFKDHPEFKPDYTPRQMFNLGIFGGTYFRPVHSTITGKNYKNQHKEFKFFKGIPENKLCRSVFDDIGVNKYGVHASLSLEYWEKQGWIKSQDPYGWVHWYCRFYSGRRSPDDHRQIQRFLKFLLRFENYKKTSRISQAKLHWGINVKVDHGKYISDIKKNGWSRM